MMEMATNAPPYFDLIIVHSFSRFFRDHFELEVHVRKLQKNGVKLVSITQEIGDDPMHAMMRHVIALFDEYQSKETAKHTIRALRENARQGFWSAPKPPTGYRIVGTGMRGTTIKRKLDIDPAYAGTIKLIFDLALHGVGETGPLGVGRIAAHLNEQNIRAPYGGRWGLATVYRILRRRTYIGEHASSHRSKSGRIKPESEIVSTAVPPIISRDVFDAVQRRLDSRSPAGLRYSPSRPESLLKGTIFCGKCGARLSGHVGGTHYRYYACSARNQHGASACSGINISALRLDGFIKSFIHERLLQPRHLATIVADLVDRYGKAFDKLGRQAEGFSTKADDVSRRLAHYHHAIEDGLPTVHHISIGKRIGSLQQRRDRYRRAADEARRQRDYMAPLVVRPGDFDRIATETRERLKLGDLSYQAFVRAAIAKINVRSDKVRIEGSRTRLLEFIALGPVRIRSPNYAKGRPKLTAEDKFVFTVAHELKTTRRKCRTLKG